MEYVSCPECGEKVSVSAKSCEHCGCKLTICPECEKAYIGEVDVCAECGYAINKQKSEEKPSKKAETNTRSLKREHELWEKQLGMNGLMKAKSVLHWIHVGLIGLSFLALILWKTNTISYFSSSWITARLVGLAALCYFVKVILEVVGSLMGSFVGRLNFPKWALYHGVDLKERLKEYFVSRKDNSISDKKLVAHKAAVEDAIDGYVSSSILSKIDNIIGSLLVLVAQFIASRAFVVFLISNFQRYMLAGGFSGGFKLSMIGGWHYFTIPILFLLIMLIIGVIEVAFENITRKRWVKKNIPEVFEEYKKFMNYKKPKKAKKPREIPDRAID